NVPERQASGEVHLWDIPTRRHRRELQGEHGSRTLTLRFAPDGKTIATVNMFAGVAIWDAETGAELRWFPGNLGTYCLAFSPDGKTLVGGSNEGVIVQWDVATGNRLAASASPATGIKDLCFSPTGRRLIGRADRVISWDAATAREVERSADVPTERGNTAL